MALTRRHILFTSLLAIALVACLLLSYDNTDRSVRSLRSGEAEMVMLSARQPELMSSIQQEHDEKVVKLKETIDQLAKANKNKCLKDPSTAGNPKEQLQSFVEGDCAPVVFVPGLMASKLVVEIDCPTLQANHPEIMAACGWSTCSWSLIHKRPDSEYLIWIPGLLSPMSFLSFTNQTCFGHLVQSTYNASVTRIDEKYGMPAGLKVRWYGNSEKSQSAADSGFPAISNLLPLPIQTATTIGFAGFDTYFTALGYQKGLSLFAVPYDFRLTHLANSVSYTLERTIRYAYELTGKKVVIVSHSLGNLNTLPVLAGMKQEDKDRMIAAYTAVTPPYGGATKAIRLTLGGDDAFIYLKQMFGMDFFNQKSMIGSSSSTQDLIPKDMFYRFRNEPWMQDLLKRVQLEKTHDPNTEEGQEFWDTTDPQSIPYSFFPAPSETCFAGFSERPKQCMTGITDLGTTPIAVINNQSYYANATSMRTLMENHFTMKDMPTIDQMQNDSLAAGVHEFPNPNVPIVYIYGSHLATELKHEWNYAPENRTNKGQYAFPSKTENGFGDGTVEVSYALPIAMKWAWEHTNKVKNAKPVKIAEYCSTYNQRDSIWDDEDDNGENKMTFTEYVGTHCLCLEKSVPGQGADCFHSGIVADAYIVDLVSNIAFTKQKVADKKNTGAFALSSDLLVELRDTLPHLRKPREDQNVQNWLYPGGIRLENENNVITK